MARTKIEFVVKGEHECEDLNIKNHPLMTELG